MPFEYFNYKYKDDGKTINKGELSWLFLVMFGDENGRVLDSED